MHLTWRCWAYHGKGTREILGTSAAKIVQKLKCGCCGCKRFRARDYQAPPPGNLPKTMNTRLKSISNNWSGMRRTNPLQISSQRGEHGIPGVVYLQPNQSCTRRPSRVPGNHRIHSEPKALYSPKRNTRNHLFR